MTPKHFETDAIRQQLDRTSYGEHSSPLFLTSSFVFEDAEHMRASFAEENDQNIYSRFSNPNTSEFIDKVVVGVDVLMARCRRLYGPNRQ